MIAELVVEWFASSFLGRIFQELLTSVPVWMSTVTGDLEIRPGSSWIAKIKVKLNISHKWILKAQTFVRID